ncbi:Eco57I restriction-modification methylase domain-containing protein [Microbacterium sp. PRC9]|uniref:Eco57I restriction-modification methylase domain-containing protein n=1 Tax=Microbacterium sp. PRC9 TaxID=2962591 RepID=UPI002880C5F2|nr:Eco57I restriction-modification methylase domain-containing protein [Microbacterium sp. PRC9]MDT0141972.1 Eco57I restriction-modification methylase domain-containing protein [Microbacterium sp. PRC9]
MLDLVGYESSADLGADTIVEPGCGDGAYLRVIIPRLIHSAVTHGREPESLSKAIRAYELDPRVANLARGTVVDTLTSLGVGGAAANKLAQEWIIEGDFLLRRLGPKVRWVVGNPPYVRIEESSAKEYVKYRQKWTTMSGRADIYIGFFEAGLSLLSAGGRLCFICADRWMHNQYGAGLRSHIIENFAMRAVIEMHESDVFDVPVAAYPAITLIERASHTSTALATASSQFDADGARRLMDWWNSKDQPDRTEAAFSASILKGQFRSNASWPSGPPERLRLIADLEDRFPSLEEVGVSVGVGMATGADKVYVVTEPGEVEPRFVKKAIGPSDLKDGSVQWSGRYIISPWDGNSLADLSQFPGLAAHFESHRQALERRYVARRNPDAWWRTIDRPPADAYRGDKLVVADIHDRVEPVLDVEGRWPLHSAYYITSTEWNLEALGGYLLSDVAGAFVEAYSVKMANGHLRVSGQYLKKIRLPVFSDVDDSTREQLTAAFRMRDRAAASAAVAALVAQRV